MGLATALARGIERRSQTIADLDAYMDRLASGGFGLSAAGQNVTVESALRYSTVWACVRAIAETVASLPCITYRRRSDGGKERATEHRLYELLHDQPNPEQTAMDYWETVMAHVLTQGNHYSQVERDDYGTRALWPLEPSRVTLGRDGAGRLIYDYRKRDGTMQTPPFAFADVFHVHGLSWNGTVGLSVIGYARETIGLGISLDDFAARYFGQGTHPGGLLQHPGKLSDPGRARLVADWQAAHAGPAEAHKTVVLEEGMTWNPMAIPPDDSQFLQSRQWQAEEIARWYRMPQHKIGLLNRATNNNIEQQAIEFVTDCIRPWLVRLEQSIRRDIIQIGDGKRTLFTEFLVDGLLRGDLASRYQAFNTGRQGGWLSADDIRLIENMNPLPNGEGKVYWAPQQVQNALALLKPPAPAPAPVPAVQPAGDQQLQPATSPGSNGTG